MVDSFPCTPFQFLLLFIILNTKHTNILTETQSLFCSCCYINLVQRLFCLCWGLTSQSTIFQSCRDGATASWVINQYFRGVKCLAQGHNTAAVGFEPPTSRSGVRHSATEPPRSPTSGCSYMYTLYEEVQFRKYLLNKCFGNVGEVFRNNLASSLCLCETISRWNFLIPSNNQYALRMDL